MEIGKVALTKIQHPSLIKWVKTALILNRLSLHRRKNNLIIIYTQITEFKSSKLKTQYLLINHLKILIWMILLKAAEIVYSRTNWLIIIIRNLNRMNSINNR